MNVDPTSLAQAVSPVPSIWSIVLQGGALGLLVFVVLHFLKHLEKTDDKHRSDLEVIGERHANRIDAILSSHARRLEEILTDYRDLTSRTISLHERVIAHLDRAPPPRAT